MHFLVCGNEGADELAAEGARKEAQDQSIDLEVPYDTVTTGAKLAAVTQSLICHRLKGEGEVMRKMTSRSLEIIKEEAKDKFGLVPTTSAVWRSIRHRDISKRIRDFLWKHAHGVYRLGAFWNNVSGYEERGTCPLC